MKKRICIIPIPKAGGTPRTNITARAAMKVFIIWDILQNPAMIITQPPLRTFVIILQRGNFIL